MCMLCRWYAVLDEMPCILLVRSCPACRRRWNISWKREQETCRNSWSPVKQRFVATLNLARNLGVTTPKYHSIDAYGTSSVTANVLKIHCLFPLMYASLKTSAASRIVLFSVLSSGMLIFRCHKSQLPVLYGTPIIRSC